MISQVFLEKASTIHLCIQNNIESHGRHLGTLFKRFLGSGYRTKTANVIYQGLTHFAKCTVGYTCSCSKYIKHKDLWSCYCTIQLHLWKLLGASLNLNGTVVYCQRLDVIINASEAAKQTSEMHSPILTNFDSQHYMPCSW